MVQDVKKISGPSVFALGKGSYLTAYAAANPSFVVKKTHEIFGKYIHASTMLDVGILKKLSHPNVIGATAVSLPPLVILQERASGTLADFHLDEKDFAPVFYQIFRGLSYCHSNYIWHRDIKPENILIFKNPSDENQLIAKLGDFGTSSIYSREGYNPTWVTTLFWKAPELAVGYRGYDETIDIWATGVMLMDMFHDGYTFYVRHSDYEDEDERLKALSKLILGRIGRPDNDNVLHEEFKEQLGAAVYFYTAQNYDGVQTLNSMLKEHVSDPSAREVISACISYPPRPTALEILEMPYFKNVEDMVNRYVPAEKVAVKECGDVMLQDEKRISKRNIDMKEREKVFVFLENKISGVYSRRSLFYSYTLFDRCLSLNSSLDKTQYLPMMMACFTVAAKIYGFEDEGEIAESLDIDKETEKVFGENVNYLLRCVDFDIIFPTAYDFIYHYKDFYSDVPDRAIEMIKDYDFVTKYLPSEIAAMAFRETDTENKCADRVKINT